MSIAEGEGSYAARAAAMGQLRVELDRMQATSDELFLEVEKLRGAAERLRGNPNFGDPRIRGAAALGARHQSEILPAMQQLVRDVNGGLRAGELALKQVARRYEEADEKSKKAMEKINEEIEDLLERRLGSDGDGPNLPPSPPLRPMA